MLKSVSESIGGECEVKAKPIDVGSEESDGEQISVDKVASAHEKERLKQSLTASQMIKNIIRTKMELKKESGKGVINKIANKILKSKKAGVMRKLTKSKTNARDHIVIDVNLNIKFSK